MRKMAEWKGQPTSEDDAVAEMFRNHRMALAMEKEENVKDGSNNMITIEEVLQIALWAHRGRWIRMEILQFCVLWLLACQARTVRK